MPTRTPGAPCVRRSDPAPPPRRVRPPEAVERSTSSDESDAGISRPARALKENEGVIRMGWFLILAFIVLVGPLSYFFGVDSRRPSDRGLIAARRER